MIHGCKRAGGFVDSSCAADCDCHITLKHDDQEHGKQLSHRFLEMCQNDGATGVALLNAIGNALVGFFMTAGFKSHEDRMVELDAWCKTLRKEVDSAPRIQP